MNLIVDILLALVFVSGFYVQFSDSWTGLYCANILFHPIVGAIAGVALLVYNGHSRARSGVAPADTKIGLWALVAAVIVASLLSALHPAPFLFLATAGAVVGFHAAARRVWRASPPGSRRIVAVGWLAVFFLLMLTLFTGVAVLPMQGVARGKLLFTFHRYISYLMTALFFVCLAAPLITRKRAGAGNTNTVRAYLKTIRPILAVMIAAAVALTLVMALESHQKRDPVYKASLSTIPIEKRAPEDQFQAPLKSDVAGMLQSSESCASNPGCHQPALHDFLISNHNLSVRTPYFQKNLAMMQREIGKKNLLICSGCHYPYMMFSGKLDYKYYKDHNGFSCAFCHQISSVGKHATDKRITYMSITPNVNHLRMFLTPQGGDPRISGKNALLVKMNPTGHGRVFTRSFYFEDKYCQVCHELQIKTPKSVGLQRNTCIRCHMQPRHYLGFKGDGNRMNHYFPGTNTAVPYSLGHGRIVDIVSRWVRGEISSSAPDANFWTLRRRDNERSSRSFWLFMNVEPLTPLRAGARATAEIITTNVGIDHQFPSAPLDLVEAWLQVTVTDARGRVIYSLGALDKTHRLPDDYPARHKLGGHMLDSAPSLLIKNRVWDIKKKIIKRTIMPFATVKDRVSFHIPADAVSPLRVHARWNYRKLNQDFVDWGLTDVHWPPARPKTMPVTVTGYIKTKFSLEK